MKMLQFKVGEPKGIMYDVSGSDVEQVEKIQQGVDGYFELIRLLDDYVALVDEEGVLKEKKPNLVLMGDSASIKIVGDMLIAKIDKSGEEFIDLTDEDIKFIQSRVSKISNYELPIMMWSSYSRNNNFWIEE